MIVAHQPDIKKAEIEVLLKSENKNLNRKQEESLHCMKEERLY